MNFTLNPSLKPARVDATGVDSTKNRLRTYRLRGLLLPALQEIAVPRAARKGLFPNSASATVPGVDPGIVALIKFPLRFPP